MSTETETELVDSGCSSLRHSRCSSVTTEMEDGHHGDKEIKSDFGVNKNIFTFIHELMCVNIPINTPE